jgi:5-(carboxyamino)imidazole ribonucleotide synthase
VTPKVHLYGKADAVHNRKMGHVNVLATNIEDAMQWIEGTSIWQDEWNSWNK